MGEATRGPSTVVSPRMALPSDATRIHRLRLQIEEWLDARGIEQWGSGGLPEELIRKQIASAEWYVVDSGQQLLGAFRLLWSDSAVWQADDTFAAYVHGLMVDRTMAGSGLGRSMLEWVAGEGRRAGAISLRLDCVESNAELRSYYIGLGFVEVGRRDFEDKWFPATLFESFL